MSTFFHYKITFFECLHPYAKSSYNRIHCCCCQEHRYTKGLFRSHPADISGCTQTKGSEKDQKKNTDSFGNVTASVRHQTPTIPSASFWSPMLDLETKAENHLRHGMMALNPLTIWYGWTHFEQQWVIWSICFSIRASPYISILRGQFFDLKRKKLL